MFMQCLVDSHYPEVGEAMVNVLGKLGVDIHYPAKQTCCGQPMYNNGYTKAARKAALHFFDVFGDAKTIICPSGSCTYMVCHHYPEMFKEEPELYTTAMEISGKTFEFSAYLRDVLHVENMELVGSRLDARVTYHDSCHLVRGLGIRSQPRELMKMVEGLELIEMEGSDECCGFGGTFSMKYPDISGAMVDEKIEHILATGAEYVVGCDMSCLLNIEGRLRRRGEKVRVLHLAQVLASQRGEI